MVRVTHDQNLVFADVRQCDLHALWQALEPLGLATPNIGTLTDMICCPGLDFCSLANAGSLNVARQIQEHFGDFDYLYDLGPIEIKMSGCMNACGHHHVGHIGILGVDARRGVVSDPSSAVRCGQVAWARCWGLGAPAGRRQRHRPHPRRLRAATRGRWRDLHRDGAAHRHRALPGTRVCD
jgi:sulfite reductase beta subunit-like hemoprotein